MRLLRVEAARDPAKKYQAVFDDGRAVQFGAAGYKDYVQYSREAPGLLANAKRRAYLRRHGAEGAREDWTRPDTPGSLSRWLLWESPDMDAAIAQFRRRFGV
jgi:hypothetical protein